MSFPLVQFKHNVSYNAAFPKCLKGLGIKFLWGKNISSFFLNLGGQSEAENICIQCYFKRRLHSSTKIVNRDMIFLLIFYSLLETVLSSAGDRSKFYQDCVWDCKKEICDTGQYNTIFKNLLGISWGPWSCIEDCQYNCQWRTVDGFIDRKWPIPQFHGKWPFIRMFGLQEPASAIFSLFNLFVVAKHLIKFNSSVPLHCPNFWLWNFYSFTCLNAWVWSTIYHSRDNDLTEKLDYISASVMVSSAFYTMSVRVLNLRSTIRTFMWTFVCFSLLVNHVAYLWFFNFSYSYNMIFNIVIGALTVLGWLYWSLKAKEHPGRLYITYYCLLIALSTLLELVDFPPIFWMIDAHSLWHLSTGFIGILFFRFISEDCLFLQSLKKQTLPMQLKKD